MNGDSQFMVGSLDGPGDITDGLDDEECLNPFMEPEEDPRPKIVLMGLSHSGKSSIKKVVFQKMSPNETWFLGSTTKPTYDHVKTGNSFINLTVCEVPGQVDIFKEKTYERTRLALFTGTNSLAVVFVVDSVVLGGGPSDGDYNRVLRFLKRSITEIHKLNPAAHYEIFMHKVALQGPSDGDYNGVLRFLKRSITEIHKLNPAAHYEIFMHKVALQGPSDGDYNGVLRFLKRSITEIHKLNPAAHYEIFMHKVALQGPSDGDYNGVLRFLKRSITEIHKLNPAAHYEIFMHKVDGLPDDQKYEEQDKISHLLHEELANYDELVISYSLTSIYDHSIFECFSKVVQKLVDELPTLEQLLNYFVQASELERAYLCDVQSKIYVATDNANLAYHAYELSCDMIDLVVDLSSVYSDGAESTSESESQSEEEGMSAKIKLNNGTTLYMQGVIRSVFQRRINVGVRVPV